MPYNGSFGWYTGDMKHILPLAILALIVAGFAYYTLFAGPRDAQLPIPETTTPIAQVEDLADSEERQSFSGTGSLYNLLTRGDQIECAITYTPSPAGTPLAGTVFTSEGSLRGDFVVPTPDLTGEMVTSIVINNDSIWQWTDIAGELVGSTQAANFGLSVLERLVSPIGFIDDVQYDCLKRSQVDRDIFQVPNEILFSDATAAGFEEGTIYLEPVGEF